MSVGRQTTAAPLLLSLALALAAQWPGLVNPYVINDDVRQQLFWMRRWLDPALYPPDLLNGYAQHYVTWGVRALYRLAAFAGLDPLFCSKLVAVGLLAWLGVILFSLADRLGGRWAAWTTLAVYGLMPGFAYNISGGLNRAFAAPLLALFVLALVRGSRPLARVALRGREDSKDLERFCAEERIDYLVVDRRHFSSAFLDHAPFFAPFGKLIREMFAHGHFAVLNQDLPRIPTDANIFILDTRETSRRETPSPAS